MTAKVITPWVGVLTHLKGIKSAPQHALAVDRVCWQGEAVAAIVAERCEQAIDAMELVEIEYEALPSVSEIEDALAVGAPQVWQGAPGNRVGFNRFRLDYTADQFEPGSALGNQLGVPNANVTPNEQKQIDADRKTLNAEQAHSLRDITAAMDAVPRTRIVLAVPATPPPFPPSTRARLGRSSPSGRISSHALRASQTSRGVER